MVAAVLGIQDSPRGRDPLVVPMARILATRKGADHPTARKDR